MSTGYWPATVRLVWRRICADGDGQIQWRDGNSRQPLVLQDSEDVLFFDPDPFAENANRFHTHHLTLEQMP